jgi:hypothetical protein
MSTTHTAASSGPAFPSRSAPHDHLGTLRLAWVSDSDGNPIQLAQRRPPAGLGS